jgi:hypothetical protein
VHRRHTLATLALLVSFAVVGLVIAGTGSAAAATTDPNSGYDISYPQCAGSFPSGGAFGVVGVNGGRAFSANPCLGTGDGASELSWAGLNAALYANTGDPGPALSSHWPNGQASPKQCNTASNPGSDTPECHYDYGWNAAADSYRDAVNAYVSLGWAPSGATTTPVANEWWLDVETANSWTSSTTLNVQALQGEVDYLTSIGASRVGFYAGSSPWQSITGNTKVFSAYPSWVPGAGTLSNAQSKCGGVGPSGGQVALSQYLSGGFDGDYRCPTQPGLSFATPPQTMTAGTPSGSISVGLSQAPSGPLTVTLASSSLTGLFSVSGSGSWSSSLTMTVPSGSTSTGSFAYQDLTAGAPTLTATASGYTSTTQVETVVAGRLATMTVSPNSATVAFGATQAFTASGADQYGNPVSASGTAWSTTAPGAVTPSTGSRTTFTAGSTAGSGSVTASVGGISGSATVDVVSPRQMNVVVAKGSTTRSGNRFSVPLTSTASDTANGSPLVGASVTIRVASGSCSGPIVANASGTSSSSGTFGYTFKTKNRGSYCALAAVIAAGYAGGSGSLAFVI